MTPKFVRVVFMMVMLLGLECVSTWAAVSAGAEAGDAVSGNWATVLHLRRGSPGTLYDCGIQYHVSSDDPLEW